MFSTAETSSLSVVLGRLSVHQDLLWFGVMVVWSLVFALWWRHPLRESLWRLLPWIAGARVLGAMVQFLVFNPPFDLFIERLIPGANEIYEAALFDPTLTADLLLAGLSYGLLYLWWWQDRAGKPHSLVWRSLGAGGLVLSIPLHLVWPLYSCWLLAILPVLPALRLFRHPVGTDARHFILFLPGLVPALSTIGPLAYHVGMLQRSATATPMGVLAAGVQLLIGGVLLRHLWRLQPRRTDAASRLAASRLARPFWQAALLVGVVGVGFALKTGSDNRREVINNRVRATAYQAGLLDTADFAPFSSPDFQLRDIQAGAGTARAPGYAPAIARASRALALRVRATQFQEEARFLVLRDGWLVETAGTAPRPFPDSVLLRSRATAEDAAAWREQRLYVLTSPVHEQDTPYYCRAPVRESTGRMLGWLEFPRREFYSSMERKWRTGPLLVTALGLVLTAGLYFQKRSNQEQERAARAEAIAAEANRLKTFFLAKVSHELRTPLQGLLGYGELLRPRVGDDAQARAWLASLQQHGEIMTRLINDLIDLSAAESGAFRLTPGTIAPGPVVRQIVDSLQPRAAAKGLHLTCAIAAAVPAWVEADGGRLSQVVLNLVGNALKFTDAGAVTVTLDAESAPDDQIRLTLTVRDTGPGITPADQAVLFEPFSRLERTAAKEGSGLGLALSAALCRAMGGSLTVESDGVHGSCFFARVIVRLAAAPVIPAAAVAETHVPAKVLVVDDNPLVCEMFVSFLQSKGCTCLAAATGAEAVARARTPGLAVIVLDLSLPDADGAGLVPALRAAAPVARIVGVSAHAGEADRERALAAGMAAFHTKPVPLETLWASVSVRPTPFPVEPFRYDAPPHLQEAFRRELPRLQVELAAALAAGDLPFVCRRAHYLRNSALVVRAQGLLAACTALEAAAARGDTEAAAQAWRRCESAIAHLRPPAA